MVPEATIAPTLPFSRSRMSTTGRGRRGSTLAAALATLLVALLVPVPAGAARGDGYAGSSGDALGTRPAAAALQPVGAIPGIDVSHHQDLIDWAQVAASGQRFVFAKATEGRTFVDSMYATNKAGAEANGIAFGAYHFAQPDDGSDDAIREADHFVDTAQLGTGNLFPVLDIERTNGLSQAEITSWILAWLGRVTERLGVRPMVYTSPAGWETRTGDTTAIADAGYTVLWIAHWGVAEPRLPANEWSGNGWTFWQYDNCGAIPGIEGCVDVDWYESSDLGPVTIPSPDVSPPIATIGVPAGVADPVVVGFDEVVRGVTTSNVVVRSTTTGAPLATALVCRKRDGTEVDCATGNVRTVDAQAASPFVPGEAYEASVNPVGTLAPVADRSGNPVAATTLPFAPPTVLEEDGAAYAWRAGTNRRAVGRSFAVERAAGARATFAFEGGSVTWVTATGPAMGKAAVAIDGEPVETFDQYSAAPAWKVERRFTGLGAGAHDITIRVLGRGAASSHDTQVVVDAFETRERRVANPALDADWGSVDASRASGGRVAASDLRHASATFAFWGTGVEWTTVRGRSQGRAEIFVDGVLVRTVDNYAAAATYGVVRSITGLAAGPHVLRIVVLGEGRRAARGAFVSVDGFAVVA
jgi:GH25 family lysozyme M1 (1,4-beta-N-acetylmuramidase)